VKNKIICEYENKTWYRVVKTLYVVLFVLVLVIYNIGFQALEFNDGIFPFIIGNLIIICAMGMLEGLFWYITRGKWGYPKDTDKK